MPPSSEVIILQEESPSSLCKIHTFSLERLPGDTAILFDCGKVLIALGETVAGRQHIENALSSARILGLTFERKSEDEEILTGLIVAETTPDPESEK